MIPRVNSWCQMSSALTMPGEFHLASPREAFDQSPGSTEFEIACRVSLSKPWPAAPCTKQPCLLALNVSHALTHSSSVVGGLTLYLSKRPLLIHNMPA